ncbi:hypothetical protein [Stenotrophomonas maltophilia]|uniref:hypothetical protein n=1 Tax=Stenotrophomonas maltophilia TaxID=40324 RepID=UPI00144187DB|nr:hypothetical protein [Stenotrophomonas maltophilia]
MNISIQHMIRSAQSPPWRQTRATPCVDENATKKKKPGNAGPFHRFNATPLTR